MYQCFETNKPKMAYSRDAFTREIETREKEEKRKMETKDGAMAYGLS